MPNVVNLATKTPATHLLIVRHRDRPGVLAHVFDAPARRQHQRAGDREHRLRGRGGGRRAHPPRRRAVRGAPRRHRRRQRGHPRPQLSYALDGRDIKRRSETGSVDGHDDRSASHLQLLRRPGRAAAAGARGDPARPARAAGRRHVGPRDQPPVEDVRRRFIAGREADIRTLGGIPANYKVLFLQGGASLQFSMVPMNLLAAGGDRRLHRLPALGRRRRSRKRRRSARVNVAAIDRGRELHARAAAGRAEADARRRLRAHDLEQHDLRHRVARRCPTSASVPLVSDTSSDIFSRPIDVAQYGLIYAGAQKNLGPAGRHARHHPRGPAARRSHEVAADDAELRDARGERLAVQHAAGVRHLHRWAWC